MRKLNLSYVWLFLVLSCGTKGIKEQKKKTLYIEQLIFFVFPLVLTSNMMCHRHADWCEKKKKTDQIFISSEILANLRSNRWNGK